MTAHLISATAFAVLAVAAAFTIGRRDAALRFAILLAGTLRFAVPTQWLSAAGEAVAKSMPAPVQVAAPVDGLWWLGLATPRVLGHMTAVAAKGSGARLEWWVLVWTIGTALCAVAWLWRRERAPAAVRVANETERAAIERARRGLGIRREVELRIVESGFSPGASGWWRGVVLLPDGLAEELSAEELTAVLAHELAHISRLDNFWALVTHMVACVFWFHPLVWWMERRMILEREMACDERALQAGAAAQDYAGGVWKICRTALAGAGYAAIGGANLKRRMEHIMAGEYRNVPAWTKGLTAAGLAAIALAAPMTVGFLRAQPPSQEVAPQPQAGSKQRVTLPGDDAYRRATAALSAHNYAEAEEWFLTAYAAGDDQGLLGLVEALREEGRTDEAVRTLEAEVRAHPDKMDLLMALGNTYVRAQRYQEGLAVFEKALAPLGPADKQRAEIYLKIGETNRRIGDLNAALDALNKAAAILPDDAQTLTTLGLTLEAAGRMEDAGQMYERALRITPDNGVLKNNLAYLITERNQDLERALTYAKQAHELLANSDEAADTMAYVEIKMGRMSEAAEVLVPVVGRHPENVTYRSHLLEALDGQHVATDFTDRVRASLRQNPTEENQRELKLLIERWPPKLNDVMERRAVSK